MATIAVIGGGISGLSAAYYLSRVQLPNVAKIVVLEAGPRLGGWIHSRRSEDGAIFEFGPRTLRPYGRPGLNTLQMVEDLGLQHRVLYVPKSHPASKKRFILANGELHALPGGAKSVLSPFPSKPFSESMPKIIAREAIKKYPPVEDESVHDFISKHFGQDLANFVMNPLCRGIYAGDSRLLSAKSCFAVPFQMASNHGSVVRGVVKGAGAKIGRRVKGVEADEEKLTDNERKWKEKAKDTATWTLKGGLQDLTDAIVDKLNEDPKVEIRLNSPVTSIALSVDGQRLRLITGANWRHENDEEAASLEADHVVSSIYSKDLAQALSPSSSPSFLESNPDVEALATALKAIPAVTVCVVNLEYAGDVLPFPGFGYLVPSFESQPLLGCVFDSAALPYHNARHGKPTTRLTVMIGGAWYERHFGDPDSTTPPLARFEEMAIAAVRDHLKIQVEPSRTHVTLQKNCIPQYLVGHDRLLSQIDSSLLASKLPLSLIGSSFKGVSVNDCAFNAKKEIDNLVEKLAHFRPRAPTETVSINAKMAAAV